MMTVRDQCGVDVVVVRWADGRLVRGLRTVAAERSGRGRRIWAELAAGGGQTPALV